ncbi:heparan-alpha-glucosaminide N-acetyltransferase [Ethanoligenens sp.]|uniref:heparan-alpha-glucosaminide N-acetyltransferase n=1 Tax=Ethanoligenens sp. TaxID=2099655 RepID=UPI0039EA1238
MELIVKKHTRIDLLDAVRGVAILAMVLYHALFDLTDIFGIRVPLFAYLEPLEPPFAGAFILLAGLSCRFSHNNMRRALRVLALAVAVSAVTVLFLPTEAIWFGILHFMGVAILLYIPCRRLLDNAPMAVSLPMLSVLFALTYTLPSSGLFGIPGLFGIALPSSWFSTPFLFWLGFPNPSFVSADYFPLLPWLFLFFIGAVLGSPVKEHRLPERFYTLRVPVLATAGRNTLLIYALHQPILYGVMSLIFYLANSH